MFTIPTKASETKPAGRIDIQVGDAVEFGMTFTLQFYSCESLGNGIERWSENPVEVAVLEVSNETWEAWKDVNDYEYIAGLAMGKMELEKAGE